MAGLFTINTLGQQKPWPGCTKHSEFNHGRAEYEENIPITMMDENIDHNTNQCRTMISITLAD